MISSKIFRFDYSEEQLILWNVLGYDSSDNSVHGP